MAKKENMVFRPEARLRKILKRIQLIKKESMTDILHTLIYKGLMVDDWSETIVKQIQIEEEKK